MIVNLCPQELVRAAEPGSDSNPGSTGWPSGRGRDITTWLDFARIVAVFAVVMLHISAGYVDGEPLGSSSWWAGNFYDSATRWCVPMLVMVSGALLLAPDRSRHLGSFYRRRMARIGLPLIFWTLVYLAWTWWKRIGAGFEVAPGDLALLAASGLPYYHLWFLYMLLGLYLFAPFLQRLVAGCNQRQFLLLVVLAFFVAAIAQAHSRLSERELAVFTSWFLRFIPFFLLGYYVRLYARSRRYLWPLVLVGAGIAGTCTGFWLFGKYGFRPGALYLYSYLSVTVIAMSVGAVYLFRWSSLASRIPPRFMVLGSRLSFGIFLVHPLVMESIPLLDARVQGTAAWIAIPLSAIMVIVISAVVSFLLGVIPGLRRVA